MRDPSRAGRNIDTKIVGDASKQMMSQTSKVVRYSTPEDRTRINVRHTKIATSGIDPAFLLKTTENVVTPHLTTKEQENTRIKNSKSDFQVSTLLLVRTPFVRAVTG